MFIFVLQPRYPGKHELGLKGLELQVYRSLSQPPQRQTWRQSPNAFGPIYNQNWS